jgi:hypothetical protein
MQSLKQVLLDLPNAGAALKRAAPANYTRFVTKGMAKAEMLVKVRSIERQNDSISFFLNIFKLQAVMTPHESPAVYVDDFIRVCSFISNFMLIHNH